MDKNIETSLVLRVCAPDMTSRGGFKWPEVGGQVSAPDWEATSECGAGLHGWLYGQGDHSCVSYWQQDDAKWLVLEVPSAEIIMLGGKCKFPRATVRFVGTKSEAADYLLAHEPRAADVGVIGLVRLVGDQQSTLVGALGTATAGEGGTATAGNYGTATAGEGGTATAGYRGTATAGNYGTATAGEGGTATAGYRGTATAGNYGTATAGNYGTATAGEGGTATAGYRGTATAGNYGTATAGEGGTATAGYRGTATAGKNGELRIQQWDANAERYRTRVAYVGEDGIKPDTKYCLNDGGKFEEVQS
ncbi:S-antigen family protein (fragment) [Cupriavidus taiwanensis]|uniref:DUF7666 domain-containing protein n=1 Tax=Cupriavidus taiwanensis TaxID=164546 RepID=UPI000E16B473